jgi:transposase-like protein
MALTLPDRVASRSLADRGLRGVKLVSADDHKGLRAAARRVFDGAGVTRLIQWINRSRNRQRCRVHRMRNALAQAPARSRTAVAAMPKTIFAQES